MFAIYILIVDLVVIVILPESVSVSLESEMLSSGCAWSLAWLVSHSNYSFTPPPSHHGTLSLNAEACKTRQTSSHTHRHPEAFDTFCMDFCSVVLDKEMGGWLLKKNSLKKCQDSLLNSAQGPSPDLYATFRNMLVLIPPTVS